MSSGRKNIMLGTAGHVDHGKTALVKLLTGCETDTLAEEKQRGLTIDLGFAPCRLADDRIVGVVDVPGHVDFIRNMVAGAHGLDVVIFVVAADDGIMPQTHEHLHILTLMGVRHGLVALTKIDLVEPARRQQVVEDLQRLLAGTFLASGPICPISNITGEGFDGFFDALNQVVNACDDRPSTGVFRVWVEDVFTIRGSGTVVTGIPTRGMVRIGDELQLLPPGSHAHVRRMQVYGADASEARAGECVALNLPQLDHQALRRGMVLTASDALQVVTMAEADLRILGSVRSKVEDFLEAHLHVGTASVLARVAMLELTEMSAGQTQMVQLRLAEPLPLAPGDQFVLRANLGAEGQSGLATIGGGRILGVSNVRLRRKKPWTLSALAARRDAVDDPARWCELMLRESCEPLQPRDLQRKCLLRGEELAAIVESLRSQGRVVQTSSGGWIHHARLEKTSASLLDAVRAFHRANPQRSGLSREELLSAAGSSAEILDLAVESLVNTKHLERVGTVFAQPGWRAQLADPDQRLAEQVAAAFQSAGWAGPTGTELAASLQQPLLRVEKVVGLLAERAVLVRLDARTFVHRDALESAKAVVLKLFAQKPCFSTMAFRDALGVSRKYAVPLLDYLDRIRFTVRSGHDRTPGAEAKKLEMKIDAEKRRRVMERSLRLGHCICDPRRDCPCDVFRDHGICPCAGERPDPLDVSQLKLTQLVRNAGCASKISPVDLEAVLKRLPEVKDPAVISGLAAADDAAIYRIADNLCLVQTVDVFTPCVDDPHLFGRICAANCLSDVYAMGGEPRTALSILAFPSETLDGEIMYQMLAGAMETLGEAGVALVGGHSIKDEEIKLGFAITGLIDPAVAAALEKPQTGDVLVLTKPLGTGVLSFCQQLGRNAGAGLAAAASSMAALNRAAAEAMKATGASACTDVTGFGLLGHLLRLARQSRLAVQVFADALPAFDGALEALRDGVIPGAVERNREFLGSDLEIGPGVDEAFVHLGCDAQTSGGLLIAVPPERLRQLQRALGEQSVKAFIIGRFHGPSEGRILLTNSTGDRELSSPQPREGSAKKPAETDIQTPSTMNSSSPHPDAHTDGCCADIFGAKSAAQPSSAGETQKAFGAFMRSVQAAGALTEKAKELVLFSLVVHSRCQPCFEAHYAKAQELGLTQAELDEAAWCAIAMGGAPVRMFYQECLRRAQTGTVGEPR